jgi:hypothetical protein
MHSLLPQHAEIWNGSLQHICCKQSHACAGHSSSQLSPSQFAVVEVYTSTRLFILVKAWTMTVPDGCSGPAQCRLLIMQVAAVVGESSVEEWTIINLTGDAHPIHLHEVLFEVSWILCRTGSTGNMQHTSALPHSLLLVPSMLCTMHRFSMHGRSTVDRPQHVMQLFA